MSSVLVEDINGWIIQVIAINVVIAIAAISVLRLLQGLLAGVNTTDELSKKDNFAFGLSLAGSAIALALIMSSAVGGEAADNLVTEALNVLMYAIFGIVMLKFGSLVNDFLIFHKFSIREQISSENMAVGIVQAANFIALGLIIKAAISWSHVDDYRGFIPVFFVFLCGQVILLGVTRLRAQIYSSRHDGESLQAAFEGGHIALAIRYAGHLVGTALVITTSSSFVEHTSFWFWESIGAYFVVALVLSIVLFALSAIARRIILKNINVVEEVDDQKNKGVAFIEAAIFLSVGLIIRALLV